MSRKGGAVPRIAPPDLVYTYKHTGTDELRYSLRSVCANADGLFGQVWIVGDLPDWAVGVRHLDARASQGDRYEDVRAKVAAVVKQPELSQTFLLMNDDFYLCRPVTEWAAFHMGSTWALLRRLARNADPHRKWQRTIRATAEWMQQQGHGDVLARQGHRPSLWDKTRLDQALSRYPKGRPLDVRGLYDMAGAGGVGVKVANSKVSLDAQFPDKVAQLEVCPWLSSSDLSWRDGLVGKYVRDLFPEPCRYEREG